MANSKIGNYQLEYTITGFEDPIRSHTHSIYVAPTTQPLPGTPPADIDLQLLGGGTESLDNVANAYGSFARALWDDALDMSSYTLWRYATENRRDFVTGGSLTLTTNGSGVVQQAHQLTFTYRTAGGSILKQVFLENNVGGRFKEAAIGNDAGNPLQRMIAYVLSAGSPVIGIDNTFPVAPLFQAAGENERVFKKIFRQ